MNQTIFKMKTGAEVKVPTESRTFKVREGDVLCIAHYDPFNCKADQVLLVNVLVKVIPNVIGSAFPFRVKILHEAGGWAQGSEFSIEYEQILVNYGPLA